MREEGLKKILINSLYRALCWREEHKKWQTIYDELISEVSLGNFTDEFKAQFLLKVVPLKYYDFIKYRQTIFEVIEYVDNISGIQK